MKKKVIFVGSFKESTKDGSVGGQMFACKSLISSYLKEKVEFILIDTTSDTVPAPSLIIRSFKAARRLYIFCSKLITFKVDTILIFSADGFSFIEKGLMALIGKAFSKKVIFAPRSGMCKDDYEKSKFMRWFMKLVLNKVDYIICQGHSWSQFYKKVTHGESAETKFIVQQNWINTQEYLANHPNYSIRSSSEFNILYIGWIEEFKGIFDLIYAIKKIQKDISQIRLYVYGSGSKMKEVSELVKELNLENTIFLEGWANHDTKLKAFGRTDFYVLPSHKEGFPNSLLEAMASELPVIATDVGGVADLVLNEINGLLVDPGSIDQLAQAILFLMNNPEKRSSFAVNARKSVLTNNSIENACKTFEEIF